MQSDVARITSDGMFVTLPSDVRAELIELCKMHGVCPTWMSTGLEAKVELNQYEELRLLLRNNGEQDLPGLATFNVIGDGTSVFEPLPEYKYKDTPEEFHSQPSTSHTRHKNN